MSLIVLISHVVGDGTSLHTVRCSSNICRIDVRWIEPTLRADRLLEELHLGRRLRGI